MMDPTHDQAIRALAHLVHSVRPSWQAKSVELVLLQDSRALDVLAVAAITAATNPATIHPKGITTTHPGPRECSRCAERNRAATVNAPRVTRCDRGHPSFAPGPCGPCHAASPDTATKFADEIRAAM